MLKVNEKALLVKAAKNTQGVSFPKGHILTVVSTSLVKAVVETTDGTFSENVLKAWFPPAKTYKEQVTEKIKTIKSEVPSDKEWFYDYKLSTEIVNLLKKADLPFDFKGHFKSGEALWNPSKFLDGELCSFIDLPSREIALELKNAIKTKTPMSTWVDIGPGMSYDGCSCCEKRERIETNGTSARFSGEPCIYPTGNPPFSWEISIPSGNLVVTDDLREVFPQLRSHNVNRPSGILATIKDAAKQNMATGFVGNTCPSIYKSEDGEHKYIIASFYGDEDYEEEEGEETVEKQEKTALASICTDLWWFSICDKVDFEARCKKFNVEPGNLDFMTVKPGVYKFTHNMSADINSGEETIYTTFEWVRDLNKQLPGTLTPLEEYDAMEINPNAYVQAHALNYPTLYGQTENRYKENQVTIPWELVDEQRKTSSWWQLMEELFSTKQTRFHHKGFPLYSVLETLVPDIEPPPLRGPVWSHKTLNSDLVSWCKQVNLSSSFARPLFRLLEAIIRFGFSVENIAKSHKYNIKELKLSLKTAIDSYPVLAKMYPEHVDSDFLSWMSDSKRLKTWTSKHEFFNPLKQE